MIVFVIDYINNSIDFSFIILNFDVVETIIELNFCIESLSNFLRQFFKVSRFKIMSLTFKIVSFS